MASKHPRPQSKSDMSGLRMVGGMMVNDRPDSIAPITQAAIMRKERIRQEYINTTAEAYHKAEMQHEMMETMNGKYQDTD